MKIICTKEEFAEMLGHCVQALYGIDCDMCNKCALFERCGGAYVDTLTRIIEVVNNGVN